MRNEKRAWFLLFGFLLMIAIPLCIFNIFIDSANQISFSKKNIPEETIAKATVAGEKVYFPIQPNERKCKEELIKILPEHFNTVAIGASLQMTLNQEMLGLSNGEFYNLGVSGMNMKDYVNTLGMMKEFGKDADKYIFLLHIDVFLPNTDTRNKFQNQYGEKYLAYLNGKKERASRFWISLSKISFLKSIFSIAYFHENLDFFRSHGKVDRFVLVDDYPEYAHYMPDGSWFYAEDYIQRTVNDVYEDIKNHGAEYMPSKHCDTENFVLFDKVIQELLNNEKKIILYFPPYCPSLYDAYPPENSPCFKEIEDFISNYKGNDSITILGSFYPQNLNISDEDYYDARHIRREKMSKAFRSCSHLEK